jgi:NAD+ kinase
MKNMAEPVKRVLLLEDCRGMVADMLRESGLGVVLDRTDAQAAVVAGGDGTILRAMDELLGSGVPVLGINAGHIGFLADCDLGTARDSLECLRTGSFHIDRLPVLEAVTPSGEAMRALNEFCISRATRGGILHLSVLVDKREVAMMASDGVLVSTPSGSTAYNLSCGGPVLHPNLPANIITAICPHLLAIRPIVVPASSLIEFTVIRARGESPVILADGRACAKTLSQGDTIRIATSEDSSPVIRTGRRSDYYARLGEKLGWGYRG